MAMDHGATPLIPPNRTGDQPLRLRPLCGWAAGRAQTAARVEPEWTIPPAPNDERNPAGNVFSQQWGAGKPPAAMRRLTPRRVALTRTGRFAIDQARSARCGTPTRTATTLLAFADLAPRSSVHHALTSTSATVRLTEAAVLSQSLRGRVGKRGSRRITPAAEGCTHYEQAS